MKAHVIVKKGYEYDDNIYSESEGGNPELICFSKEDADIKVNELNKQEFKTSSLSYYSYDLEEILNVSVDEYERFNQSLSEKYGKISKKNSWDDSENILQKLENVLIFNTLNLKIKAYDYRRDWDFAGGEWETRISIEGESLFNGKSGICTIFLGFGGKTYERSFLTSANNKVPELCNILGIPTPLIKKETKFLW